MDMMRVFFTIVVWTLFSGFNAYAQSLTVVEGVETRRAAIEAIASEIEINPNVDYLSLREELRAIRAEANIASRPLRNMRDDLQADLDRLGPPPSEGAGEAEDIQRTRTSLSTEFRDVDDAIRQADLNITRATRLLEDIANRRRDAFYSNIFARGPSPLSPVILKPAVQSFVDGKAKFDQMAKEKAGRSRLAFILLGLAAIVALVLFFPVRRWTDAQIIKRIQAGGAAQSTRTAVAASRTLARLAPGFIGGFIVYETALAQGLLGENTKALALAGLCGLIGIFVVDGVATSVFAPKARDWRLIPIRSRAAMTIRVLLWSAAVLFAVDAFLNAGAEFFAASAELTRLQGGLVAILGAVLLFLMTRESVWVLQEDHTEFAIESRQNWKILRHAGQVIAIAAIIAALVGYTALARYVVTRIFFLGAIVGLAWFTRSLIQTLIGYYRGRAVKRAQADEVVEESEERLVFFWVGIIADILLTAFTAPIALMIMGFEWVEVRDWMRDAFFGFQIGPITISIAQIISAIVLFVVILLGTRFIQRGLDKRVFAHAKMDEGVRNSFRTLIGYCGLVIAAIAAVAILGLKLANVAIIAGALSVGIGFGLQSIVNNFVSGLILLFERPIKVGDWIVVASGEGFVKRISVRSTEIETFDKASIIVPNSELISSAVTNWTHKDKYSRVLIAVGVAYKEDPDRVIEILYQVMRDNRRVVSKPEPFVYFQGFGDSSLDFEMRVFIRSPDDRIIVQNELRIATFKAFREADIEIPFPQRDLHIRSTVEEKGFHKK